MISRIIGLQTFKAFHYRSFIFVFLNTVTYSIGHYIMMVALGWLILEMTNSPLSLGMVWAARSGPFLVFGIFAGAVADKIDRRRLLIVTFIMLAVCAFLMGTLISRGWIQVWSILLVTFIIGSIMTFNVTSSQALVVDIVGPEDAMSALSMSNAATRLTGIFSSVAAGWVIELLGIDWCFYIMCISYLIGIIILLCIRGVVMKASSKQESIRASFIEGLQIVRTNQIVLTLMVMAIICETLGFSYQVVLPVFARDILKVGAVGLGTLNMTQCVGALIGVLTLASLGNYKHKGWLILVIFLLFGIFLILFSQSPWYLVSLILICIVGVVAGAFDAMQHILLQLNVANEQRGRAMGMWMLSIGFMPVGSMAIGAIATLVGAQLAVSINGVVIIATFAILAIFVSGLRRA